MNDCELAPLSSRLISVALEVDDPVEDRDREGIAAARGHDSVKKAC